MRHPLYTVSIDELPFDERIIAVMLGAYLSRRPDALDLLTTIIREVVAIKFPTPPTIAELAAIPLDTVLDGEKLADLIDTAAEAIKQEQVYNPDPQLDNIFSATKDILHAIDGSEIVSDMTVHLAEYITKCYYALKFGHFLTTTAPDRMNNPTL